MCKFKNFFAIILPAAILLSGSVILAQGHGQGQRKKAQSADTLKLHEKSKKKDQQSNKEGHTAPGQMKKQTGDQGQGDSAKKRPAGWDRGEKAGWENSTPPGWAKWDSTQQKGWQKELDDAKEQVREKGKKAKKRGAELDSLDVAVEAAARKGVPVEDVQGVVEKGIARGLKGREMEMATRGMAEGIEKGVESAPLTVFVHQKLDEGLRGDELATQIQQEVQRRHEAIQKARQEEEEKKATPTKRWWEFWK